MLLPADWAGLTSAALPVPAAVPGIQIDGYFPDTSRTNTNHGWHDSQFVVRLPDHRNTGAQFYRDGRAVEEWNHRFTQLTIAAKSVVSQRYGRTPHRTIATGISHGGYLVRWQLENRPHLYDGGVDWEGTLWTVAGPNPLTFLPPGTPACDADYSYALRRRIAGPAVSRVALTGKVKRPLLTVDGTYDVLLPIGQDSDVYAAMTPDRLHRYYRVEQGTHVDGLVDAYPDRLRPLAPCHRAAFVALER